MLRAGVADKRIISRPELKTFNLRERHRPRDPCQRALRRPRKAYRHRFRKAACIEKIARGLSAISADKRVVTKTYRQNKPVIPVATTKAVIPGPARKAVIPDPAVQRIRAIPAEERVLTLFTQKTVIAAATINTVGARAAKKLVISRIPGEAVIPQTTEDMLCPNPAEDRVIAAAEVQPFDLRESHRSRNPGQGPGFRARKGHAQRFGQTTCIEQIPVEFTRLATDERVIPETALDDKGIIPVTAQKAVIANTPEDCVCIGPTINRVRALATKERVITRAAREAVIAQATFKRVCTGTPDKRVIARITRKAVVTCPAVDLIVPGTTLKGIVLATAIEAVITRATIDAISSRAAKYDIPPST
jgi:hypothetical protein